MSRRVKITFESVNAGKYSVIDPRDIAETNARVRKAMKLFKQNLNKKKMKNLLKVLVKTGDTVIGLQKEIDFAPSVGLILYEPIYGTVGTVVYENAHFTGIMDAVINPTDGETMKHMLDNGWVEYERLGG
jgi:hypothetical protein